MLPAPAASPRTANIPKATAGAARGSEGVMDQQVTPGKVPQQEQLLQIPPAHGSSTSLLPVAAHISWARAGAAPCPSGAESTQTRAGAAATASCSALVVPQHRPAWLTAAICHRRAWHRAGEGVGISQLCPGTSTGWIHAWLGEPSAGGEKYPRGWRSAGTNQNLPAAAHGG